MEKRKRPDIKIFRTAVLSLVMIIPLVVYGKIVDAGLDGVPWYADNARMLDIFLYYKQAAIMAVSCLMLPVVIAAVFRKKDRQRMTAFLPLAMYVILDIISSLVSSYREYALKGMMEQFESVWVIAGYFVICIGAYLAYHRGIFVVFGIFTGIAGGIGTLQLLGIDPYRTELVKRFCMPQSLQGIAFHITVGRGRSYCSLSNPNYVGVLCCLTIPVLMVLFFSVRERREKILYGISDGLMFCSLIGSRSKSGILVLTVCMVLLAVLFREQIATRFIFFMTAIIAAGVLAGLVMNRWGAFSDRKNVPDTQVSEISTNDTCVEMVYHGKRIFFDINAEGTTMKDAIIAVDEKGASYAMTEEQGILRFGEQALSQMTVTLAKYGDYTALEIWDGNFYWYFTNQTGDGTWYYLTYYGKPDKLVSGETAIYKGLEGMERIVSGRGYIWSRTIPLLGNHILLGSGQDSFAVVFPNNDYLGMARWGYKDMLITKPHCMYLQVAVQSGLLSLAVLIFFWMKFQVKTMTVQSGSWQSAVSRAIAVGVTGYLLMGISNDSNVGTAPIFWMLIGIGTRLSDKFSQ